jgi:GntR family phosphonate transport system transcriptional regulator
MSTAMEPPLWQALTERIEHLIAELELGPGDRLPTECELSDRLGANRHTVRRALKQLEEQGRIDARQGRGRFLRLPAIHYRIGPRPRFTDILTDQQLVPSTRLLHMDVRRAPEEVARILSLRSGSKVVMIERMGLADGNAVSLSTHYFGHGRFPHLVAAYERRQSITAALRDCGLHDYVRRSTRVTSRLPTARERRLLGLPRHVPLIVTRSCNVDRRGWPIECGEACMASDRIELEITSSHEEPQP